jgi:glycosyltransferase involved in cell wall biosynthesis
MRHSAAAIAGNAAARDVLRQKGYRGPVEVVPQFGFDPALFVPAPARPERPFTIGYLGRLEARKGTLDLLEACAGLRGDWRLRLVGYGPLADELPARAAALGLGARLEVCPAVPSTEVVPVYHGFDAVVLPSRSTASWVEQFGRILVEGMACGVPAVGSDSGEIPHVLGSAGLVFPEGDVGALRGHLQRLIDEPGWRAELVRRGRERFLSTYTQEQVARATVAVYRQALTG